MRQFEKFAERFRVVRYDLRGFGKSALPTAPYSTLDDLHVIMEKLDIKQACVHRHVFGGQPGR